jgi:GGDEF domain-containing protein
MPEDRPAIDSLTPWLTRLRKTVREVDLVGQLADARFIVLLPQTKRRAAEASAARIRSALGPDSPFVISAVEIASAPQITQLVAGRNALATSA